MRTHTDLLVIGAGPAGTAAGITAVRAGRHVTIVDRATFPRDKTCGDGLTAGALRWLEHLDVPLTDLGRSARVDHAVLVAPSGHRVELPMRRDGEHARVMRRVDLDALLLTHARAAGAEVIEGRTLTELKSHETMVDATLDDGTVLRAPFAIAADGQYSTARRLLAPDEPPARGEWSAFRQYFQGLDELRLWVLFERDLLPGYAWVFPLPDGRANVGLAIPRRPGLTGKVLASMWRALLARARLRDILGPHAEPESPHRAWPIPSHLDPGRLADGRVLFVGDAAGVVDPMTGEGIAQALETGALAASAVVADGRSDGGSDGESRAVSAVGSAYRRSVEHHLGRDLRFAARLQRVLAHRAGAEGAVRVAGISDWTRRNFARWMFEDYPRAILATPDRWHRQMLTPPGAYVRATTPA